MNHNSAVTTNSSPAASVMNYSFVYEEFINGDLVPDNNIQVAAKHKEPVIIPDNIQLIYPLPFKAKDLVDIIPRYKQVATIPRCKQVATIPRYKQVATTPRYKQKILTKSPNQFFIYRKAWIERFRQENFQFSMIDISGFIAIRWREEPEESSPILPRRTSCMAKFDCNNKNVHFTLGVNFQ
nr:4033_t:CDS:2 [Entrophospora candida]